MRRLPLALVMPALMLAFVPLSSAAPWAPGRDQFADSRFLAQWSRTDDATVRGTRSWFWGPAPWFDYYEFYRQSPAGLRQVQYFDKARMEINDPADGTVTNGLLVVELVTGMRKLGDAPDDGFSLNPASIPVAGDPPDVNQAAPTYASFQGVTTSPGLPRRDPDRRGQPVVSTIERDGTIGDNTDLERRYAAQTRGETYIETTGHTVPRVFWGFLNQRGRLLDNGQQRTGPLIDWVAVMGYPISDAYWLRARVGGTEQDVLVQLFERRVLTFTPANPPDAQVEMGNVGQHAFQWRYPQLGRPWDSPPPPLPIFYASDAGGGQTEVFRMSPDGANQTQYVSSGPGGTLPYSVRPAYGGYEQVEVLIDSPRADGIYRQIYAVPFVNGLELTRLTYTDTTPPFPASPFPPASQPSNAYNPAISPDGSKIAFVSDQLGRPQIFLMAYHGGSLGSVGDIVQLTGGDCDHEAPAWSPDGRVLVWMERCVEDFEIARGELVYEEDSRSFVGRYFRNNLRARLQNIRMLTENDVEDGNPRFSPDGGRIAFQSRRDGGIAHIFTMAPDGGTVIQRTRGPADDSTPVWSPDGSRLAFASPRDGDWEIYRLEPDGTIIQLTSNTTNDQWPVWAP